MRKEKKCSEQDDLNAVMGYIPRSLSIYVIFIYIIICGVIIFGLIFINYSDRAIYDIEISSIRNNDELYLIELNNFKSESFHLGGKVILKFNATTIQGTILDASLVNQQKNKKMKLYVTGMPSHGIVLDRRAGIMELKMEPQPLYKKFLKSVKF